MKNEKNLCEFELQDSPHELDRWLCWPKSLNFLADKFGEESLYSILRAKGLMDENCLPYVTNPKFKHFRSVDIGFTDPGNKWQSVKAHYFVTFRGLVKILAIIQKATSTKLS